MPKPTGRNKTASPYARKQEFRDVSTMGARPTELRPNKRESYQVATQVPKASARGTRTARANDINREYRMDMLRDVARKKRGY